jgi:hypothetical protein
MSWHTSGFAITWQLLLFLSRPHFLSGLLNSPILFPLYSLFAISSSHQPSSLSDFHLKLQLVFLTASWTFLLILQMSHSTAVLATCLFPQTISLFCVLFHYYPNNFLSQEPSQSPLTPLTPLDFIFNSHILLILLLKYILNLLPLCHFHCHHCRCGSHYLFLKQLQWPLCTFYYYKNKTFLQQIFIESITVCLALSIKP